MKKLTPLLIVLYLLGGCSSNGGTVDSGDGLGVQTTETNILLLASLAVDNSISADAFQVICEITVSDTGEVDAVIEPGLTTITGTMTITSRDLVDESGLTPVEFFAEGVTFDRYRVSYLKANPFAPNLQDRVWRETFTLPNGSSTGSFTVILLDLDLALPEFAAQSSGSIASYNVKVTAFGKEFNGTEIAVSAETFLEIGNVDNCPGGNTSGITG